MELYVYEYYIIKTKQILVKKIFSLDGFRLLYNIKFEFP